MSATIDSSGNCELRNVISSLQAEGTNAAEIHVRMSVVHGKHCMSDSAVRKWCRQANKENSVGQKDVHDEGSQGHKSSLTTQIQMGSFRLFTI